ncbi:MAG: hypothetical protein IPL87_00900 [Candidatus Moraniibacteriota bacterium]|nr:MAG: hypothetical protein IPL87_00900 [Candidatus Moranbacteria bacterium]
MRKGYIILLFLIGTLLAGGIIFFLRYRGNTDSLPVIVENNRVTGYFKIEESSSAPQKRVSIQNEKGEKVVVNNFLPEAKPLNEAGDLALTPAPDVYTLPDYDIAFYEQGAVFRISINVGPIDTVRKTAENEFLRKLGISQEEAYKLNTYVGVSKEVDETYAGRNIGLSFCNPSR